jgi:hypothetical protein
MVRQPAIRRRAVGSFKHSVATVQRIPARTRARAQPHSLNRALSDGPKRSPKPVISFLDSLDNGLHLFRLGLLECELDNKVGFHDDYHDSTSSTLPLRIRS